MAVRINKAGSHLQAGCINDFLRLTVNRRCDFCDLSVKDSNITAKCGRSAAIHDQTVFDENIIHGALSSLF